jgi:(1->4)-alpha-D-glucan 1-alpha-D-glucosylmutase
LLASWRDGRIKQHVVARTLAIRRQHPSLFANGSHVVLRALGPRADHVVSFARRVEGRCVIVVVPRLMADLLPPVGPPHPRPASWGDTRVELPRACYHSLSNRLTDKVLQPTSGWIKLSEVLADLPVAALVGVG